MSLLSQGGPRHSGRSELVGDAQVGDESPTLTMHSVRVRNEATELGSDRGSYRSGSLPTTGNDGEPYGQVRDLATDGANPV
jgi:hypothetical protein